MDNNMAKGGANTNDQMYNAHSAAWITMVVAVFVFPPMSMVTQEQLFYLVQMLLTNKMVS